MAKTVVGLFDTAGEAEQVVRALVDSGFNRNEISVIANDARGEHGRAHEVGTSRGDAVAEGAGAGAVGGTVLGGAVGLLVGVGLLTIPGIGPVLAAGPLAAALGSTALGAGIGAAAGGLVGSLVGAGVPESQANYYAEGVRRGGTLVSIRADEGMAERAYQVMQRFGAVDIDRRGASWREEGWSRFDPSGQPFDFSRASTRPGFEGGPTAGLDYEGGSTAGPDYARGQRDEPRRGPTSDFARGQRDTDHE